MKKMKRMLMGMLACVMAITTIAMPSHLLAFTSENKSARPQRYVIPKPLEYYEKEGTFTVNNNTKILIKVADASKKEEVRNNIANYLQQKIKTATGYPMTVTEEESNVTNVFKIELKTDAALGEEGYKLNVTTDAVHLIANQPAGLFRGLQTIRQLFPEEIEKKGVSENVKWELPNCDITDKPEYEYRSTQLDLSRHFWTKEEVKRQIDLASQYKINKYHMHLSDDQGWRLEMKGEMYGESLSKLTTIGASTSCTVNGKKAGFLTQEDFKEIVAYAQSRYVEIIPEFDMPAHAWAALVSLKFLNSTSDGKPHADPKYDNTKPYEGMDVGWASLECRNEKTYEFIDEVFKQVSAISPSKYIHVGGDEAHKTKHEDYVYFINRVTDIAKKYGKTPIGWQNYDANVKDKKNSIGQFWGTGDQKLRSDINYVVSKADRSYLDIKYDKDTPYGLTWVGGPISIEHGYTWDPTDIGRRDQILGIEAPLWTETVAKEEIVDYMVYPRLLGYAEIGWTPKKLRDWNEYKGRLNKQEKRLEYQGVNYYKDETIWPKPFVEVKKEFKFDENKGTTITTTDHKYTGNLKNVKWVEGKKGSALSFEGNGCAEIGTSDFGHDWTISTWVKNGDNTKDNAVLVGGLEGDIKLEQYNKTKKIGITKYGVKDETFDYSAPKGEWVYLSFVGNNQGVTLYVNGEKKGHTNLVIAGPARKLGCSAKDGLDNSGNMNAQVDNFMMTNVAFTESQIKQLYIAETAPEENENILFKCNENQGTSITATNKTSTGTLTNVGWTEGIEGSALSFEGNGAAVIGNKDGGNNWTISTWVKKEKNTQDNAVLAGGSNADIKLEQWQNKKVLGISVYGKEDAVFNYTVPEGQWTYITFVGNSTGVTLYVNGKRQDHIQLAIPAPIKTIGAAAKQDLLNAGNMKAKIDNYRIYANALDDAAVANLYKEEANAVVHKEADYTRVDAAIAAVPKDLSIYTAESVKAVTDAVNAVKRGLKAEEQAKVDAMAKAIEDAIAHLVVNPDAKMKKAIFSIDAGRKYFSKDQIKQIIKKAHDCGYTDVELILGNDGLRFALNDMTITANGKTYESEAVKKAITAGNDAYYKDPNGDYLTETEMDEILAYAKQMNIGIIPVINSPGHMDAMLVAMKTLGIKNPMYQTSKRTVDLNNAEAIAFNKEMIKKYATYFAKQSEIFNFGCDEYANDVNTGGWASLQNRGDYPKFIAYVNDLAKIIKDAGMKPMCFNDGIYYNSKDNYGTFDKDIIISYWTAGWSGFNVASANYLHTKGHKILNTNDGWYWVLGRISEGGYNFDSAMKNIKEKPFHQITGDKNNTPSIGSMQAVWCDDPSQAHDMPRIMQLMDAFSNKHSDIMLKFANYDAVNKAMEKVPADTTGYTKETVDALNKAIADVNWTLKADQQAKVDAMAKAIEEAIKGLRANKEALESEIAKAPTEEWKYTKESWKAYQKVLEEAKKLVKDDHATPEQVKEVVKALQEAYKGLKENPGLTPIGPSSHKIPWTDLEPAHKEVPMTELKPATKVEKPNSSNQEGQSQTPNTGVETNTAVVWSVLLGAGIALLVVWKHRKEA